MAAPTPIRIPAATPGRTLAVRSWEPETATGKPPVVCVHGLLRLARDFDDLAADLCRDRTVWAVDMAGRGDSDRLPDPSGYGYPTYVADAMAVLAAIADRFGVGRVDWVGTSMGGLIALMLPGAAAASDRPLPTLRRVVLNDIGAFVDGAALARILAYATVPPPIYPDRDAAAGHLRSVYAPFAPPDEAAWTKLIDDSLRPVSGGWTLHYDPAIATALAALNPADGSVADVDLMGLWDIFPAETLILRGEESDVLSPATALAMTARAPDRSRLVTVPGCGHAPMLVRRGERDTVRRFLDNGLSA